jgi:hypothetical protein
MQTPILIASELAEGTTGLLSGRSGKKQWLGAVIDNFQDAKLTRHVSRDSFCCNLSCYFPFNR